MEADRALASDSAQNFKTVASRSWVSSSALGMRDELDELARRVASLPFSNVGRDGNRCMTHLRDQSKFLIHWKGARQQIDSPSQIHTFLPDLQVLVVLDLGSIGFTHL